jgi:UDP-2,3-diacylglucosamine pyrophosphatase LpxH
MNTDVREERLIITSDLHMGNRLFPINRSFVELAKFALRNDFSLCVNGDGVDVIQMSFAQLTRQLGAAAAIFKKYPDAGLRIYYTVGNHDIVLEHFLQDWGGVVVVPFINVESGERRIRVEHGHMYDDNFLTYPGLYTAVMVLGRWAISIHPRVYEGLEGANSAVVAIGHLTRRLRGAEAEPEMPDGIVGEHPSFRMAAEEISMRGFDAVVLGHTHRPGKVRLQSGGMYFNTGAWMMKPYCVAIDEGRVWFGPVDELLATPLESLEWTRIAADAHRPSPPSAPAGGDATGVGSSPAPLRVHRVG